MFTVQNRDELKQTIKLVNDTYNELTSIYYKNGNHSSMNYKKLELIEVSDSTKFSQEAREYIRFMSYHFLDDCMVQLIKKNIRSRVKSLGSFNEKISQYISNPKTHGKVMVNKSINDLVGLRFLVYDLNNNLDDYIKFLEELKNTIFSNIYRPYIKNKSNSSYCAIHFYLKDDNKHFPWEIQLWDPNSVENNKKEHSKHEKNRTKY